MPVHPQINFPDNTADSSEDLGEGAAQSIYITKKTFFLALAGENLNSIRLLIAF